MKGIVFVEFLDLLDDLMSPVEVEDLIASVDLESGGAYTAVGTYDFNEMITLVVALSEKTGIPVNELQKTFGRYLFGQFVKKYPAMFEAGDDAMSLLSRVNDTIHVEVMKLYPDAEVPHFSHTWLDDGGMVLDYRSTRPFADVAEGLIVGCIEHFGNAFRLEREDVSPAPKTHSVFTMRRSEANG